jgi:transposase
LDPDPKQTVIASSEIEQLRSDLHGRWRRATRAMMVLLPAHGLPSAQIAALVDCHPATVRRWIARFNAEGAAGLADRPRSGRAALGGRQLVGRIAALLSRPGPWTLPRIRRYLGWPGKIQIRPYRRQAGSQAGSNAFRYSGLQPCRTQRAH